MKISNPLSFFPTVSGSDNNKNAIENRLLRKCDIKQEFSEKNSEVNDDWHSVKTENDSWVRYSFDGGNNWILKYKYSNILAYEMNYDLLENDSSSPIDIIFEKLKAGYEFVFSFNDQTRFPDYFFDEVKKSSLSFVASTKKNNQELDETTEYFTSLPNFRYFFNDLQKEIHVIFLIDLPSDTRSIRMNISFNGSGINALVLNDANTFTTVNNAEITNGVEI